MAAATLFVRSSSSPYTQDVRWNILSNKNCVSNYDKWKTARASPHQFLFVPFKRISQRIWRPRKLWLDATSVLKSQVDETGADPRVIRAERKNYDSGARLCSYWVCHVTNKHKTESWCLSTEEHKSTWCIQSDWMNEWLNEWVCLPQWFKSSSAFITGYYQYLEQSV